MSEQTELPRLAVGYMDQGMGHGHYAVLVEETEKLFKVTGLREKVEQVVLACNAHKDLLDFVEHWAGHDNSCDSLDEGSPRTDCTCGYDYARGKVLTKVKL